MREGPHTVGLAKVRTRVCHDLAITRVICRLDSDDAIDQLRRLSMRVFDQLYLRRTRPGDQPLLSRGRRTQDFLEIGLILSRALS